MRPQLVLKRLVRVFALMQSTVHNRPDGQLGIMVDRDVPALQYQQYDRQLTACQQWISKYIDQIASERDQYARIVDGIHAVSLTRAAERDEARAVALRYYRLYRESSKCAQKYIDLYRKALDCIPVKPSFPGVARADIPAGRTVIDDGFGNYWPARCPSCGALMQIVRPGDCRCSAECWEEK